MMYLLLLAADALFALQFLFTRKYRALEGDDLHAALISMIYASLIKVVILLVTGGFRVEFSLFSCGLALIHAALFMASTYASLKSLATANLSVYSIFMMLGSMILPFSFGILFLREPLTAGKVGCVLFILIALMLTLEKGGSKKGAYKYYFAVFFLNGMAGVTSTYHQSRPELAVNSNSFMVFSSAWALVLPLCYYLLKYRKFPQASAKTLLNRGGYALCNGVGNLLLMIALAVLPASVQFPIVTGGTMVFSALVGLCLKEKLTRKKALSLLAAVIATVLVIL